MKDKKRKSDWNKYLWLVGKKTLNPLKEAGIIALWYSVFGFTWIFLTDRILQWLVSDPDQYNQIQLAKGWLFVALTVVFIFWIVKARIEMIKTFVSDIISTTKALDQTEEELSLQRAYTAEIIRKAPVMIVVWNHEGRLIAANPYTMEVLGYTDVDQVLDKWETDIIAPQDREDLNRVFATMQKDKRFLNHETALIKRSGEIANVIWNSGLLISQNTDHQEEYISFGVDVTEKRKITDQIRKLAYHDSLTDLPNRSSLETTVTELLKRPKVKFALAYLDIDNFKYINDSLGHHIGDELLKHIATCLKKVIQPPHHVARLGGDEFALIIDHFTDESQVHTLIDSLKEEIGKTWYILDHSFYISLSIGVAVAKDNGHDFNTLYKNADIAMYYAKKEGKNRLAFFMDHIETDSLYHIDMAKRIKRAIEEQEFELYYQPILHLKSGKIHGFEALIRWNEPDKGFVSPGEFIPLAEETGQIYAIEAWVVHNALTHKRLWDLQGLAHLNLSLNLSSKSLISDTSFAKILELLSAYSGDLKTITIEITETAIISDLQKAYDRIHKLKQLGLKIALDDFGTGYSSLNHIKMLNIDIIKLDRSFINSIEKNDREELIVQSVIQLVNNLGYQIVAEGIETPTQYQYCTDHGCHFGQGYHLYYPMSLTKANALLQEKMLQSP